MINLFDHLDVGEQNAIHQQALCQKLHIDSSRLKKLIQVQGENPPFIVSSNKGYFVPCDKNELKRYVSRSDRYAYTLFRTNTNKRAYLNEIDGQAEFKIDLPNIELPDESEVI